MIRANAALETAKDPKPIYRWAGFLNGKPDLDVLYKTKAEGEAYYQDVRRVQIVMAGKVTGVRGRPVK